MSGIFSKLQPAVKKETIRVSKMTGAGVILMWVAFGVLHMVMPEKVPLDYTVFLGGICGGIVAVLNFLLMGMTVQKVAAQENEDTARNQMKASYSQRLMLQILWIVAVIAAPCFQLVAGIAPLLFPSIGIKLLTILGKQ